MKYARKPHAYEYVFLQKKIKLQNKCRKKKKMLHFGKKIEKIDFEFRFQPVAG